ncbi:hypothetical protein SeMB42_g00882 [Synchytrium endobioticum]|uniref:Mediator of RNA polymerase II transcription subunit 13 n=1 Tax=Synchytrium endobioticum TaxID=286115 RepID=A0A507DPI6_9FUNG|nr:hypothetical protein SeMB42_g00882 [Synchytrium endobioticum]
MVSVLDEHAFTNSIVLTNIKRIRWRRYHHVCSVTDIPWRLSSAPLDAGPQPSHHSPIKDPLLCAHLAVLKSGIPCTWRLADYDPSCNPENPRPTRLYANSPIRPASTNSPDRTASIATSPLNMDRPSPHPTQQTESRPFLPASPYARVPPIPASHLPGDFSLTPATVAHDSRTTDPNHPSSHHALICRELWIFEFGDLSLQNCTELSSLKELESGWLSSENVYSAPGSSHVAPSSVEYGLFIHAMHNLLERSFGIVRLGHRFVMQPQAPPSSPSCPPSQVAAQGQMTPQISCELHMYITGTNIVIQPCILWAEHRLISRSDLQHDTLVNVALSPSGLAAVASMPANFKEATHQETWASLLNTKISQRDHTIPSYLMVRVPESNITCLYPSNLIYVQSNQNISSSSATHQQQVHERDLSRCHWTEASLRATKLFPAMPQMKLGTSIDYWDYVSVSRNVTDLALEKAGLVESLLAPPLSTDSPKPSANSPATTINYLQPKVSRHNSPSQVSLPIPTTSLIDATPGLSTTTAPQSSASAAHTPHHDLSDGMSVSVQRDDFGGDSHLDMEDDEIGDDDFDFFDKPINAPPANSTITSIPTSIASTEPASPAFSLTGLLSPVPLNHPTPRASQPSETYPHPPTGPPAVTPQDPPHSPTPGVHAYGSVAVDGPVGCTPMAVATPGTTLLHSMTSPATNIPDPVMDGERKPFVVESILRSGSNDKQALNGNHDVPEAWSAITFTNLDGLLDTWPSSSTSQMGHNVKWTYSPAKKRVIKRKRLARISPSSPPKRTKMAPDTDAAYGVESHAQPEMYWNPSDAMVETDGVLVALHSSASLDGDEASFWSRLCGCRYEHGAESPVLQQQTVIDDMLSRTLPNWRGEETYAMAVELALEHACLGSQVLYSCHGYPESVIDTGRRMLCSPDMIASVLFQLAPVITSALSRDGIASTDDRQLRPSIKGPLTIQQYSELQESDRAVAKYGRFSLRKKSKRTSEPVIDLLSVPDILALHDDNMLALSPSSIRFWEKLRLAPVGGQRNIMWLALCPAGQEVCDETRTWMIDFACAYAGCQLGTCLPFTLSEPLGKPVIPVHLVPLQANEAPDAQRFRSYVAAFERLALYLNPVVDRLTDWLVIFIVDPFPHISNSMVYLSWIFSRMLQGLNNEKRGMPLLRSKLVIQVLPAEVVLNPDVLRRLPAISMKEVVFGVYSKCRQHFKEPELSGFHTSVPTPSAAIANLPYAIATARPRQVILSVAKRISLPVVHAVDADRVMHIAIESNTKWICAAWCDQSGEMVDVAAFRKVGGEIKKCVRAILERTLILAGRGGVWWRLVFGFGSTFDMKQDLAHWVDSLQWFVPDSSRAAVNSSPQPVGPPSSHVLHSNSGTPHTMSSPMGRSPTSTLTPPPIHSASPRVQDGLPMHFIASISLVSFNSIKVASQFIPNEGSCNTTTSSSSGVVGRMGFDVADDVGGSFDGRHFSFPLPCTSENSTGELFKEGLQSTSAVVVSNQRIPLWSRDAILPLATGWLVHVKVADNWTGMHASGSADMSIASPHHRAYTQSASQEVSLLWHHHNPHAELLSSNYASWGPPLPPERPSRAIPGSSPVTPHHAAIVRDILKQYHSLKYLRHASLYWTQGEAAVSNSQPWMFQSCDRMISMLCNS